MTDSWVVTGNVAIFSIFKFGDRFVNRATYGGFKSQVRDIITTNSRGYYHDVRSEFM